MNIEAYIKELGDSLKTGHANEHAYRSALESLMNSLDGVKAVNDPKRSAHGNPDFIFLREKNLDIVLGYAEAKDVIIDLDKAEQSEQMRRYAGYDNLYLTNYIEFRFFKNGEKYQTIQIAKLDDGELKPAPEHFTLLLNELRAFVEKPPEKIRSGKRLAQIMGGKARRIRDNVLLYLQKVDDERNQELERMHGMMKELLVPDLAESDFADMYAQTLVYGLFIARYSDKTPKDFTRQEARYLVPKSNPFLQKFFDHIVGQDFDRRLLYIVDELCGAFVVSNVREIVHEHFGVFKETDYRDPIIHFYEDFLKEYDPELRKRMGAYYTPTPVVRFIIGQVDEILKTEFGITKGLADSSRHKVQGKHGATHRVQILDPAVGTATFLNEIIRHIRAGFVGQQGRWPSYVVEDLMPRLHGFELMMGPYTIAHLKLGMTLKDSGVDDMEGRLGIYLTNSLEKHVPVYHGLLFDLASAVSEESRVASEIKSQHPIMVVIGNPPYSGHSSNNTQHANGLVEKYRTEPGGQQKLQEKNSKYLQDDYVKFIALAESMIMENGEGILAMITNNGYIDNPTFRGMRWHLSKTFDKIMILDLHGSKKKKEIAPGGGVDENVFDIQQGVAIILAIKTSDGVGPARMLHSEIYGLRTHKFHVLENERIEWREFETDDGFCNYVPTKSPKARKEYNQFISLPDLFIKGTHGLKTHRDSFAIADTQEAMRLRVDDLASECPDAELRERYGLKDTSSWQLSVARERLRSQSSQERQRLVQPCLYRPFDNMFTYLDKAVSNRPRKLFEDNVANKDNLVLGVGRQGLAVGESQWCLVTISKHVVDTNVFRRGGCEAYPLYLYGGGGLRVRDPNLNSSTIEKLLERLEPHTYAPYPMESQLAKDRGLVVTPEDVLNYIYAVLHSARYREQYREFLRYDFPRIPQPKNTKVFSGLRDLGEALIGLHLMMDMDQINIETMFPVAGSNIVEKLEYRDGGVWFNTEQFFGNVSEDAWRFLVGGYRPAEKYLKDRKGSKLSNSEIEHYQRIIATITKTNNLTKHIDTIWWL